MQTSKRVIKNYFAFSSYIIIKKISLSAFSMDLQESRNYEKGSSTFKEGSVSLVGRALDLRPEGPGSRLVADRRPPCTLMAPGACKIRRGCNVLHVPCQKYLWGYLSKVMVWPLV